MRHDLPKPNIGATKCRWNHFVPVGMIDISITHHDNRGNQANRHLGLSLVTTSHEQCVIKKRREIAYLP